MAEGADLTELELRISRLEHFIGSINKEECMSKRVIDVYQKLNAIITKIPSFTEFFDQYTSLGDLLMEKSLRNERDSLPTNAKLELLLAAQDRLQKHAQKLKKLSELTEYINPEALQAILASDTKSLQKVQAEQIQAALLLNSQLNDLQ